MGTSEGDIGASLFECIIYRESELLSNLLADILFNEKRLAMSNLHCKKLINVETVLI